MSHKILCEKGEGGERNSPSIGMVKGEALCRRQNWDWPLKVEYFYRPIGNRAWRPGNRKLTGEKKLAKLENV